MAAWCKTFLWHVKCKNWPLFLDGLNQYFISFKTDTEQWTYMAAKDIPHNQNSIKEEKKRKGKVKQNKQLQYYNGPYMDSSKKVHSLNITLVVLCFSMSRDIFVRSMLCVNPLCPAGSLHALHPKDWTHTLHRLLHFWEHMCSVQVSVKQQEIECF